jgi:hypothetical protein
MDGAYAGNAGAISRRSPGMARMPEMQEQFPAIAMDGVYAGNAGAISGYQRLRLRCVVRATFPQ